VPGGHLCRLVLLLLVLAAASYGQTSQQAIEMTAGGSFPIDYQADIGRISIGNPEIVDAVIVNRREILLLAKSQGVATIVIWAKSGGRTFYRATVNADLGPARKLLKETFPNESIHVQASRDSLSLTGRATSQAIADRAAALVAPLAKSVVNNLEVVAPEAEKQILLRVRFAELDRTMASALGVNLISTGSGNTPGRITTGQFPAPSLTSLSGTIPGRSEGTTSNFSLSDALNIFAFRPDLNLAALIKALQNQGVLQILAEPNLVTTDGKEASFLAGGEFPVPIVQGGASVGAVTIQFREFGIRLSFLPNVTSHNTIKLHVKPEVSMLDFANGVTLSGFNIPGLTTRRMETSIELTQGQSFVIAGLIDNRVTENLAKVPGLANIPLLGTLFKSRQENKSKTELIVVVTPEITSPSQAAAAIPAPAMPNSFMTLAPPGAVAPKSKKGKRRE
jgi:pilus assembly protein CpaC